MQQDQTSTITKIYSNDNTTKFKTQNDEKEEDDDLIIKDKYDDNRKF